MRFVPELEAPVLEFVEGADIFASEFGDLRESFLRVLLSDASSFAVVSLKQFALGRL